MKVFKSSCFLLALVLGVSFTSNAQQSLEPSFKNKIKTNITSLFLHNYSLQYEREITGRISVALAGRYMPQSPLPFKNRLINLFGVNEEQMTGFLNAAHIGNTAITPEIKYFLSNKQEGMYLSAFYKYAKFNTRNLRVEYTEIKRANKETISLNGELTTHVGGVQLGWQKNIGNRLVADIFIIGPQFGSARGEISGETTRTLSPEEQQLLRQNLEEYKIRYYDEDIAVFEKGAKMALKGPWAGIRTGINIGFRF